MSQMALQAEMPAAQALLRLAQIGLTMEAGPQPIERHLDAEDTHDIQATLGGDGSAFERLVRRHQDQIARRMWRFTRDPRQLEELVHDAFVQAYVSLGSYRSEAPLSHWLAKIATRVGYRHWKRQARLRQSPPLSALAHEPADEHGAQATAADEAAEMVHLVLAQLPPRDRLVLTLVYLEGCSVQEAAELTGWSKTMVKVQAHRARAKMKKILQRTDAGNG